MENSLITDKQNSDDENKSSDKIPSLDKKGASFGV